MPEDFAPPQKKEEKPGSETGQPVFTMEKKRPWAFAAIIIAAFVTGLFAGPATTGYFVGTDSPEATANKAVAYLNSNIVTEGAVSFVSVDDTGSLYQITISYMGNEMPIYATKDGKFLILGSVFDTSVPLPKEPEVLEEIPKADTPEVQLFVMSQCPYGVQAENTIKPVAELLGNKMGFGLYFIANEQQNGTFSSLHGQSEVDEDMRQVCIIRYYPEKLFDYLVCANADYHNIGSVWENCATEAGIDKAKIKACFDGEEGRTLLKENIKLADGLGVGGSPTLLINGVLYSGARTTNAYKEAICSAFNTAPAECSQNITTTEATSTPTTGRCV